MSNQEVIVATELHIQRYCMQDVMQSIRGTLSTKYWDFGTDGGHPAVDIANLDGQCLALSLWPCSPLGFLLLGLAWPGLVSSGRAKRQTCWTTKLTPFSVSQQTQQQLIVANSDPNRERRNDGKRGRLLWSCRLSRLSDS